MHRDSGRLPSYRHSYLYRYHPYPYTFRPIIKRIPRLVNDSRGDIFRWSGFTAQLPPGGLQCLEASGTLDTKAASGQGQVAPLNGLESDGAMDVDEQPQNPEAREDTTAEDRAQIQQSSSM